MDLLSYDKLLEYVEKGWVVTQKHPTLDLTIYNYSRQTEFEKFWDGITLNCRGTVFNSKGALISKTLPKFFNYEEGRTNLPDNFSNTIIYEKLDGSYIQLFNYQDQWVVSSKGSFTSDQAIWAEEILNNKYTEYVNLDKSLSYVFELIKGENRIVVDYGEKEDLILLAIFDREREYNVNSYGKIFKVVKHIISDNFSYDELKNDPKHKNKEGFVIKFNNGERCKIKFEEYKRLHSIVTNTTSYDIWKVLMNGGNFDEILIRVPDEFMDFVITTKNELLKEFNDKLKRIDNKFLKLVNQKEFASKIKDDEDKHFLFNRLNFHSESLEREVWKSIKPEFKKAFTND